MEPEPRPHLSVCIPCYDMGGVGHVFLRESFEKLVTQTFQDFEVVISDYSKTPLVKELCDAYQGKLPIRYFVNTDPTGGMGANANNAIRHATGKIIKLLFQDDFLYSNDALEKTVSMFDIEKDTWLVTGCEHTKDGHSFYRPHYPRYNDKLYLGENTIGSPSVLTIKNENPLWFDTNLKWLIDCDYYKRCYDAFGAPKIVDALTVAIRVGNHQITNTEATKDVRKEERKYVVKKFHKNVTLPSITLVAVSSIKLKETIQALEISMERINFNQVLLITDQQPDNLPFPIRLVYCEPIRSSNEYSRYVLYELCKHVQTDFALIVQYDGFVARPEKWSSEFLQCDYIGAPWPKDIHYTNDRMNIRVGNGGFSLRSKKLLNCLNDLRLPFTDNGTGYLHEDGVICVYYRRKLEEFGIKFAPVEVAARFSHELDCEETIKSSFGFHKYFNNLPKFFLLRYYFNKLLSRT